MWRLVVKVQVPRPELDKRYDAVWMNFIDKAFYICF